MALDPHYAHPTLQCIYPVIVIIIVHSQRSYIDAATTRAVAVFVSDTVDSDLSALGVSGSVPSFRVPSVTASLAEAKMEGGRASLDRRSSSFDEQKRVPDGGGAGGESAV